MGDTPPLFALFIGINTYHPEAALAPLHGAVADARALRRSVAARYGVAVEQLALLQDDEATRAAILAHIDTQFVARAARWAKKHKAGAPAPHFLLYFAGYGAQMLDARGAAPRMVDTLVAYDSRVPEGRDLCPADFAQRVAALRAHGCTATLILDCGHMATVAGVRACAPDVRQPGARHSAAGSASSQWRACGASLLTAARWGEAVREQSLLDAEGFTTRGSFTFSLQQTLLALPGGAPPLWADFAARVIDRTHALAPDQTPCICAGDSLLLGGARLAPVPPISVMSDDEGQLWLDAGRAHGLLNGSRVVVTPGYAPAESASLAGAAPTGEDEPHADGPTVESPAEDAPPESVRESGATTLAVVEIARAGLEFSLCTLVEGVLPALPAPAALVQAGRSRMRIRYAGVAEPQIASGERGALAARINAVSQRVDKAEDVTVVHADGALWLCDAAGERISRTFVPEAIDDMRAELAHRARYAAALAQRGSSAELPWESISLTLERLVFDEGGFAHAAPLDSSAGEPYVAGGMPLVLHVTNHSARPLEIALFRFGPLCDIACVWPPQGARTEPLAPGATRTIGCSAHLDQQVHTPLPDDCVEARLLFRVYGSAEPMAAALLEQGPLGSVLEVTQAGMSSAPLPPPEPWVSAERGLRLLPPAGALPLVGGQIAQTRGLPRVETPPGFSGSLQWLGPTARAGLAGDAWPAALAAHPTHFRPHATVGAAAGLAIAGFALTCSARSRRLVSAATPMHVHIAPPAGAALLAFAWDGVNAYPVGRCPVGGHALEVTWLPPSDDVPGDEHAGGTAHDGVHDDAHDGAAGAAQVARALRIFLCEVRGTPAVDVGLFAVRFVPAAWAASASRAAFVRNVPGGTLRYTAAGRARPNERIAIIVHGFADDSAEEADWLLRLQASANGPLYDRVLCFEWESLHTDVRANGERLRDAVAALAMNEASGATIDLFAHSMGALVARVYVELLGGDAHVRRCFFTGPPNLGTPLASTALFMPWLLTLLMNLPAPSAPSLLVAWALGVVAWQMQGPAAMHPNAPLLAELNSTRNGARLHYHVIAGNAQDAPAARAEQWRRVLAAGLDAAADWFYEGENDWVVGVRSCLTVPMVNHPGGLLLTAVVDATHLAYYRSDAVRAQMLRWLAPIPQNPPLPDANAEARGE